MAKLIVDGREIEVPDGYTVLQACEEAGAEIPRFCYHERLSIAGNCRMCLVEWVGAPKPQASCALGVKDLRPDRDGTPPKIRTNSPLVKKAREGVMEFLLINHPLDCPICDQGGECDLQDQAMAYGVDSTRYYENKRAVEDKYIGPLVKTIMNRCIHCTRCVRFTTEVAGISELGATGRGEDMEITTYLEAAMTSEMQGNVIDLCPVGALTAKPYAFRARPWELNKAESIDVMDAVGSAIRVDSRMKEVMRIMPRINDAVNEEWISDKSRFIVDGLRTQRLDRPYVRKRGKLAPATWQEAFAGVAKALKGADPSKIGAIAGDLASVEDMFALKSLMDQLGVKNIDCRQDGAPLDPKLGRASYIFNPTLERIEEADAILFIGSNPRKEAAVFNSRIRKHWLMSDVKIGVIGEQVDLTYDYDYIGAGTDSLNELLQNADAPFRKVLEAAERPVIVVGQGALARNDGRAVLNAAASLADLSGALGEEWNGFGVLHTAASRVGGLDIGFVPAQGGMDTEGMMKAVRSGEMEVLFLLGADEIDLSGVSENTYIIYIGTHGDRGAHGASIILPGAAYTEKNGTYVNTEGRVQLASRAIFPPGEAREDWAIVRALSAVLDKALPFDSFAQLRAALHGAHPHLACDTEILAGQATDVRKLASGSLKLNKAPFQSPVKDFYLTNPIARASKVMAECSALLAQRQAEATGTHG